MKKQILWLVTAATMFIAASILYGVKNTPGATNNSDLGINIVLLYILSISAFLIAVYYTYVEDSKKNKDE